MKKGFILLLAIILLNIVNHSAFGHDALNQSVSTDAYLTNIIPFQTALQCALKNNNNIRAFRNHLNSTEKDIGLAKSALLPHAKLREEFVVTNNPIEAFAFKLNQTRATPKDLSIGTLDFPGAVLNFLTALTVEQTILDKKSIVEIKMAKKEYSANQCLYVRKKEDLVHQVAQACLKITTNREIIKVIEIGLKEAQEHLTIAKTKLGKGLYSDVARAQSAVEEREQRLISARKNLDVAKRNLGLLLGTEEFVEISDSVPELKLDNEINYYQNLACRRSDIKAMELRVQNAKNNIEHEQADWWPTLKVAGSYLFYDPYYPFGGLGNNYIAGAYLKWDILDGNRRVWGVQKAKFQKAEADEYLAEFRKEVNFRVYEMYSNVAEHQNNLEFATTRQKAAEEGQILIEKSWSHSQLPFVSVIDSQDNLDRARLNLVNTKFDYQEDLITLLYESGIIYQTFGIE